MSDFENSIFEKMRLQEERDARVEAERESQRLAEMAAAAEEAKLQKQAMQLGMQAVILLQKYSVPSMKVWEYAPTGRKVEVRHIGKTGYYTLTEDEMDYYHVGHGWSIYTVHSDGSMYDRPSSQHSVALSSSGKIIDRYKIASTSPDWGWKREKLDKTPIEGIVDIEYSQPASAIRCIRSDFFQEGIASLIRGKGEHKSYTD